MNDCIFKENTYLANGLDLVLSSMEQGLFWFVVCILCIGVLWVIGVRLHTSILLQYREFKQQTKINLAPYYLILNPVHLQVSIFFKYAVIHTAIF